MSIEVLEELLKKLKEYPANMSGSKDFEVFIRDDNWGQVLPLYEIKKISINYHWDEPCLIIEKWDRCWSNIKSMDEHTVELTK